MLVILVTGTANVGCPRLLTSVSEPVWRVKETWFLFIWGHSLAGP